MAGWGQEWTVGEEQVQCRDVTDSIGFPLWPGAQGRWAVGRTQGQGIFSSYSVCVCVCVFGRVCDDCSAGLALEDLVGPLTSYGAILFWLCERKSY